jgi:uncharacterized protein (DUF58 family)
MRTRGAVTSDLRKKLDWGAFAPLRLRARAAAEGAWSGAHRSIRKGSGVEFAGHRAYVHGDDLRFIDRHALMRHGALMLREFETETDRSVYLVVDASASMGFRGTRSQGAKLGFACVIAAALAWIAIRGGDRVALDWLGGARRLALPRASGNEAFERLLAALEQADASGSVDGRGLEESLASLERRAGRGALCVVFSDLLDLPPGAPARLGALSSKGRALVVVQTLDPDELELPFDGPVRLQALEGDLVVDTDAPRVRQAYLHALEELRKSYRDALVARAAELIPVSTADDPTETVRRVLTALGSVAR